MVLSAMDFARLRWAILAILAIYIATLALTGPETYSDTSIYAANVLAFQNHRYLPGSNPLWEFGHLIWRPLAWVLWRLFQPWLAGSFDGNQTLQIAAVMVGLNWAAGAIAAVFVF